MAAPIYGDRDSTTRLDQEMIIDARNGLELGQVRHRSQGHVRSVDHQGRAIGVDHVHAVELAAGMVGVPTIGGERFGSGSCGIRAVIRKGPASELALVTGGDIEIGRHREVDPHRIPPAQLDVGERTRAGTSESLIGQPTLIRRRHNRASHVIETG